MAFAGEALTQVPVTLDYPVVEQAVMDLKIGSLEDGTAIGSGLATAVNRLRRAPDKSKVILLLTDGENNKGLIDPRTAAATAAAFGIKVYTIGVGTIGEAPIPTGRGLGGFRYEMLPVRIDEPLLQEIAAKTGGRYFRAKDSEALSRIFRQIDALEKTPIQVTRYTRYDEATRPLILLGPGRAGARAAARLHAGGAGPMTFDAPLLLVPRAGCWRLRSASRAWLARRPADPAGPALVALAGRARRGPGAAGLRLVLGLGGAAGRGGLAGPRGGRTRGHDRDPRA